MIESPISPSFISFLIVGPTLPLRLADMTLLATCLDLRFRLVILVVYQGGSGPESEVGVVS